MHDFHEITNGEIYRRLEDIDARHGGALDRIDGHLGMLNTKVSTHERMHAESNIRIQNVEREVFRRGKAEDKAAEDGITITVPTDGKTIVALLVALAALLAAVAKAWGR